MKKVNYDPIIKSYEPLMHKLIRKFKIKKDYEDVLQLLRIKTWQTLKKKVYDETKGAEFSTMLYKILWNYLIDINKINFGMEENPEAYFIQNPLTGASLDNINSQNDEQTKEDFELFYNSISIKDQQLLILFRDYKGNKNKIAKKLKCHTRTIDRHVKRLAKHLFYFFREGEL